MSAQPTPTARADVPGLAEADAGLVAARERRTALAAELEEAERRLIEAQEARADLAQQVASGTATASFDRASKSLAAVSAATEHRDMLTRAAAATEGGVVRAEDAVFDALREEVRRRLFAAREETAAALARRDEAERVFRSASQRHRLLEASLDPYSPDPREWAHRLGLGELFAPGMPQPPSNPINMRRQRAAA